MLRSKTALLGDVCGVIGIVCMVAFCAQVLFCTPTSSADAGAARLGALAPAPVPLDTATPVPVAAPVGDLPVTLTKPRGRTQVAASDAYGRTPMVTEYATKCPTPNTAAPCAVYDFGAFKITHNANAPCVRDGAAFVGKGAGMFSSVCDAKAVETASALMPDGWDAGP